MSDPEDAQNEANDELDNDNNEINDYDDPVVTVADPDIVVSSSTTTVSSSVDSSSTSLVEEYDDDEPLEDYVVKLVVNGEPESSTSSVKDLVDAGITDSIGDHSSKTSAVIDAINGYTSTIVDELAGNGTAITGGEKRWLGWTTRNWIIFGLIALCIIGIIIALLLCLIGRRGKNKRTQKSGTATTTKEVVTKGISTDQRYQQIPNQQQSV